MKYIIVTIQLIFGLIVLWGVGLVGSLTDHFPPIWKITLVFMPIVVGLAASIMWFYCDYKGKNHSKWFWTSCLSILFFCIIWMLVDLN